jgi:hypothetical protein
MQHYLQWILCWWFINVQQKMHLNDAVTKAETTLLLCIGFDCTGLCRIFATGPPPPSHPNPFSPPGPGPLFWWPQLLNKEWSTCSRLQSCKDSENSVKPFNCASPAVHTPSNSIKWYGGWHDYHSCLVWQPHFSKQKASNWLGLPVCVQCTYRTNCTEELFWHTREDVGKLILGTQP